MREVVYILMSAAHRVAKCLLGRQQEPIGVRFVDVTDQDISAQKTVSFNRLNGSTSSGHCGEYVPLNELFPVENATPRGSNPHLRTSFCPTSHNPSADSSVEHFHPELWRGFIDRSDIPVGYRNGGLKYAGFVASGRDSWCLPSWIWTNAAIVRYLCAVGDLRQATLIADRLLSKQEAEGSWIVRSDYTVNDEIPVVAPNDSSYIANNALLEVYKKTGCSKYLQAAEHCAEWIMGSARSDGLVWTGYNHRNGEWLKTHTIVDTGFTAGLFANLFEHTGNSQYVDFLERFVERFIELFYDSRSMCFATSIDENGKRGGGTFSRGQAWSLEGLIPAFRVLKTEKLEAIIEANVRTLVRRQLRNGGWPYNFDRPYLGEDCKGIPVIAKVLLDWNEIVNDTELSASAKRALNWCTSHTSLSGTSKGGIFSFNSEGAVVHNFYTKTAFVYSSAYALESWDILASHG